jgi:hypothetical protein
MGHVVTPEPSVSGGGFGVVGHVATPEPSPDRWHSLCHEVRGEARAL